MLCWLGLSPDDILGRKHTAKNLLTYYKECSKYILHIDLRIFKKLKKRFLEVF